MKLADCVGGRDNNLNAIRMIAALAVLVSHAYPLARGPKSGEPLYDTLGMTLGTLAVYVFFAISGFLIAASFQRARHLGDWVAARILRLFPALVVVLVLTVSVLGPLVSTLPIGSYVLHPETASYVPRNLSLVKLQFGLPGVFENIPYPNAINGSLWTLAHEVACYGIIFVLGLFGLLVPSGRAGVALCVWTVLAILGQVVGDLGLLHPRLYALSKLTLPFAVGAALFIWQRHIPFGFLYGALLGLICWVFYDTPVFKYLLVLLLAYWVFLIAYIPKGMILNFNKLGDYSYGTYIYAFPMQQLSMYWFGNLSPLQNILIATPLTLIFAVGSWHLVEKPALDMRHRMGALIAPLIDATPLRQFRR